MIHRGLRCAFDRRFPRGTRRKMSQGLQERDQRLLVIVREIVPEFVTGDRAGFDAGALPAAGDVVVAEAFGVKPILQRGDGAAVLVETAIP